MNSKIFTLIVMGMIANHLYASDIEDDVSSIASSTSSGSFTLLEQTAPTTRTATLDLGQGLIDVSQLLALIQGNQNISLTIGDQVFPIIAVTTVVDNNDDASTSSSSTASSSSSSSSSSYSSSSSLAPRITLAIPDDTNSTSAPASRVSTVYRFLKIRPMLQWLLHHKQLHNHN